MSILVTGISGLDRSRVYKDLPTSEAVLDLGAAMLEIAQERRMTLDEHNILHAGRDTLAALRAAAISRINLHAARSEAKPLIVSTHSVFSRLDGLVEGLTPVDLRELQPTLWVTLIDGPQAIEDRLRAHTAAYFQLDVWDIVKWQELEVFFSHHLANELNVRHYVVPVTQPEVFAAICRGDRRDTAYASYPMSHAPEPVKARIRRFVEQLKDYFIVFDPSAIESSHGTKDHHTQRDRQAVGSHTIVRDLDWFIGINADTVVAYWPEVIFSSGMSDELRYAFEIGKRTVLVTERKEEAGLPLLSPFLTYKASVFWSSQEYFEFLELPAPERDVYSLCQQVMVEQFRAHDSGASLLTAESFARESTLVARHRLRGDVLSAVGERLDTIAGLVFRSWQSLLDRASHR
jgi:adenylate kinase